MGISDYAMQPCLASDSGCDSDTDYYYFLILLRPFFLASKLRFEAV